MPYFLVAGMRKIEMKPVNDSFGSGYCHCPPDNERLSWDRLPMSVAFMAFAATVIADRVHANPGKDWLLVVLMAFGLFGSACNSSNPVGAEGLSMEAGHVR